LTALQRRYLPLDGQGGAEHFDGDYTEYHDWKVARAGLLPTKVEHSDEHLVDVSTSAATVAKLVESTAPQRQPKQKSSAARRDASNDKKRGVKIIKKKIEPRAAEQIEAEIADTEHRLQGISEQMGMPEVARDHTRLEVLTQEYQNVEGRLRELYDEWDRATEVIKI